MSNDIDMICYTHDPDLPEPPPEHERCIKLYIKKGYRLVVDEEGVRAVEIK